MSNTTNSLEETDPDIIALQELSRNSNTSDELPEQMVPDFSQPLDEDDDIFNPSNIFENMNQAMISDDSILATTIENISYYRKIRPMNLNVINNVNETQIIDKKCYDIMNIENIAVPVYRHSRKTSTIFNRN